MAEFIPGIELNRKFFQQVIKPLLDEHYPGLKYSAGLLGEGSDVLGYDTPLSMDHNWGPHMRIFLTEEDFEKRKDEISEMFRYKLPKEFMGYPTNFTEPVDTYLVQQMKPIKSGPVNHLIEFFTIKSFFEYYLGFDPSKRITPADWLVFPQHALIEVTGGEVYYDQLGLEDVRKKFAYYPDDVWLYILHIQWAYIGNEESFMGRAGEIGDELGSNIIATHIVKNIMKLCFLMEKRYFPYIKWFGTGFSRLRCASELTYPLMQIVHAHKWSEREEWLGKVYEILVRMHNELNLTKPIKAEIRNFEGRPYKVLYAYEVVKLFKPLLSPYFLKRKFDLGAVDQFIGHAKISRENYVYHEFKSMLKKEKA